MNLLLLPLSMLAFLAVMAPSQWGAAAERPTNSVVTIEGMHCPACAKAVAVKLKRVPDVADAAIDVKSGLATVSPVKGKEPSARSLWEAVEAGGYRPTRIEGPSGTFTSKPTR
jgi:copper chaperone